MGKRWYSLGGGNVRQRKLTSLYFSTGLYRSELQIEHMKISQGIFLPSLDARLKLVLREESLASV